MATKLQQYTIDTPISAIWGTPGEVFITTDGEICGNLKSFGAGQYNQWADITENGNRIGSSSSTASNCYGACFNSNITDLSGVYEEWRDGIYAPDWSQTSYLYLITSAPSGANWSSGTISGAQYSGSTQYKLHSEFWGWWDTPWPRGAEGNIYFTLQFGNKTGNIPSAFSIDGNSNITVTVPNTNGMYCNGSQVIGLNVDSGSISSSYSGQNVYAVPYRSTTSTGGGTSGVASAWIECYTTIEVDPWVYNFTWRTFSPSISESNWVLTANCNPFPQNGIKLYRDGSQIKTFTSSDRTYTIPISDRVGSHTWKVVANGDSSVRDVAHTTYYATNGSSTVGYRYLITGNAYTSSNEASTTTSARLSTPSITDSSRSGINGWKLKWGAVTNATSYSVKLDSGDWTSVSTNLEYTFTGVSQGQHTFYVRANWSNSSYNSNSASKTETLNKLGAPYDVVFTRGGVNSGTLSWSTQYADTSETVYGVYSGDTRLGATNDTSYTITDISQGSNTFKVRQEFQLDSDYNSDLTSITYDMTKLITPATITLQDIKGNVYQIPGDTNSPIVKSDGKIGIKLTYPTSDSWSGITYKLYNNTFNSLQEEIADDTGDLETTSSKSMYWNTRTPSYGTVGKHRIYPQAVFESDHDYDSPVVFTKDATTSNPATAYVDYDINTLSSPTLVWNGNNETSRIYESYLTWLPSTAQADSGDYPDFYIVYVIADGDTARTPLGNIYTILQPQDTTQRLGVWVPDPQPFNDANYGLIPQMPSNVGTTNYTCCVAASSYSPWYVGTSMASESNYQIIRLAAPTNIFFDENTFTLSWSPVLNATHYYLWDSGLDITPYPVSDDVPRGITDTQYTFDALGAGLHKFQVSALKITTETVN